MPILRYVKITSIALVCVVLVVVIGVVAWLFSVDPKIYAQQINRYLLPYDLRADFRGEIAWQLYPRVAVVMDDMAVVALPSKHAEREVQLVEFRRFSAAVALLPLFHQKIEVKGIALQGLNTKIGIDQQGRSPWLNLVDKFSQPASPALAEIEPGDESESEPGFDLSSMKVDSLVISDLALEYDDQRDQTHYQLDDLDLTIRDFRLDGEGFPLRLDSQFSAAGLTEARLSLESTVGLAMSDNKVDLASAAVVFTPSATAAQPLSFNLEGSLNWAEPLTAKFTIEHRAFNIKTLLQQLHMDVPVTNNAKAMSQFAGRYQVDVEGETLAIVIQQFTLDQTKGEGQVTLVPRAQASPHVIAKLTLNTFIVDDYLPPAQAESRMTAASPLPLDLIKQQRLTAELEAGQLLLKGLAFSDVVATGGIDSGVASLKSLSATLGQGSIGAKAALNANAVPATLNGKLTTTDIDVGKLLLDMAGINNLVGKANSDIVFTSSGNTDEAMVTNLNVTAHLQSTSIGMTPINLEQRFCEGMALLQRQDLSAIHWAKLTPVEKLDTTLHYQQEVVKITSFDASIQKLATKASGALNVGSGEFRFPLELNLSKFAEPTQICGGIQEKWRKQSIPILCKGNYNKIDYKTCLPDFVFIENRLKASAQEKIDEKKQELTVKLKEKEKEVKTELEQKAKEKEEKLRNKLNDLLNR